MRRAPIDLPTRLETERLILRPFRADDGPAYLEVCLRNKEHLLPYEAGNPALAVKTLADAESLVRQFAADWVARRAFLLGAWEKATGAFAAQIYVGVVDWDLPEFTIGYFVDRDHEGRGFVSEGVRAALRLAFETLRVHRVRLECNELNVRSWHVAERCGFRREGHRRETRKVPRLPDGRYSGDYIYGLLREEWERLG